MKATQTDRETHRVTNMRSNDRTCSYLYLKHCERYGDAFRIRWMLLHRLNKFSTSAAW